MVHWISIKIRLPVKETQVWSLVQVAQMVKRLPAVRESLVRSLSREDPLEKEMATHSSTLPWKIPWTEEPGRLQPVGSQRVGHDWATSVSFFLSRKIPHASKQLSNYVPQLLSPWAAAAEAHVPKARASREKPQPWEAHAIQLGSSPRSPQLEKVHTVTKTQHSQNK